MQAFNIFGLAGDGGAVHCSGENTSHASPLVRSRPMPAFDYAAWAEEQLGKDEETWMGEN